MSFEKSCGKFTLTCSDPHPIWVRIATNDGDELRLLKIEDLPDLRYLIDRALDATSTPSPGVGGG